jgi:hypothetical protein
MLSLEMIGSFSDAVGSQRYPSLALRPFYPDRGDFIAIVGRHEDATLAREVKAEMLGAGGVGVVSMTAPAAVAGVDASDQRSYWAHGFPALMITDTAYLRNRAYHGEGDRADTLDYVRMGAVVRAVYAAVVALASSSTAPSLRVDSSST